MFESIASLASAHPKTAILLVWSIWLLGALWEFRINRRRHFLGAQLLILFCVLAYLFSMLQELGTIRWLFVCVSVIAGIASAYCLRRRTDRDVSANGPVSR